jgi:hypothetical protein
MTGTVFITSFTIGRKKLDRPCVTLRDRIGTTMLSFPVAKNPPEAIIACPRPSFVPKTMFRTSLTILSSELRTSARQVELSLGSPPVMMLPFYSSISVSNAGQETIPSWKVFLMATRTPKHHDNRSVKCVSLSRSSN